MTAEAQPRIALRLKLDSGTWSIPLHRVHRLAGYATLMGQAEDYFLGWLKFHGEQVPVFDLNRVVCDAPTPESFGSRIVLLSTDGKAAVPHIGLLAGGVTDTFLQGAEGAEGDEVLPLDIDSYLPLLYTMIPTAPAATA